MIVGNDREESATATSNGLIGMLVASTIKGGETLIRIGEVYEVVTPIDVWVDPNRATPPAPDSAGVGLPESELAATANGVGCKLKTACRDLDDIVVQVQSEQRPSKVALRAIDGRELPAPVAASAVQPGREGTWTCTLPGWSVVRNLPLKEGTATAALQMTGSLENGTDFRSDTTLEVVVRR